jgi:hypothetical protein
VKRNVIAVALLAAGPVLYPVVSLAGGSPHFPYRGECVYSPSKEGPLDALFGRFAERGAATAKQRRVLQLGFQGALVEADGCGYLKVVVHGVPNLAVGRDLVAEARRVGVDVTLEQAAG